MFDHFLGNEMLAVGNLNMGDRTVVLVVEGIGQLYRWWRG